MKILITTDTYLPVVNGVVNSTDVLVRYLRQRGHEVKVITLSQTAHSYKVADIIYIGSMNANKIYPQVRIRTKLAGELIQEVIDWKPDVVHSQVEFSTFIIAHKVAAAVGAPLVHTYHTVYEDYYHYFMPNQTAAKHAVSVFSRYIASKTDCIIAPTEKIRDLLLSYNVSTPISVIPSGIDLAMYAKDYDEEEIASLKRELNIPENNKVIVNIGRIAKEKNIDEIIDDVSSLDRDDITLLLVGDGPYRKNIEEHAVGKKINVVFAGMVPHENTGIYYHLGDVFVSASTSETQGLTYDEALASGLPALCRKDPCIKDVIIDGYNGGQFVTGREFVSMLDDILADEDKLRTMSQNARESAKKFSGETFALSAEELYLSLIEKKRKE